MGRDRTVKLALRRIVLALMAAFLCAACEPRIPILLWHSVGEVVDPPRFVSAERFERQIDRVLEAGFTPITAAELDAIEAGERAAPPRPVVLSFDDGYENFYHHALPVLRARGVRATMFLIADRVRDRAEERVRDARASYLVWPEVHELISAGVSVESHSVTHQNLKHLDDATVRRELEASRALIESKTGANVTVLAYPFGGNSPHTQRLVEEAGYRSAHSVIAGLDERYARLRYSVHAATSEDELSRVLEGTWWASSSR